MEAKSNKILRCYNCGNETNHLLVNHHISHILYDIWEIEGKSKKMNNEFHYLNFQCTTCSGLNIIGGFKNEINIENNIYKRLYPIGPDLRVPEHQIETLRQPVPEQILNIYEEVWHLRKQVPNAFANQIRKCLEIICNQNNANGENLYKKLVDLKDKGLLPGTNEDLAKVIRQVGNIGSHDSKHSLDIWDVELLDDFFKIIVNYIYITPSKLKRLNTRLTPPEKLVDRNGK